MKYPLPLLILLSMLALSADIIAVYVGPIDYMGELMFTYGAGEAPIVRVTYLFDEEIGDSLVVTELPEAWSHTLGPRELVLSGGQLLPGQMLVTRISFRRYVMPGSRPFMATGLTIEGEVIAATGTLIVTEMIILRIVYLLSAYKVPILMGTAVLTLLQFYLVLSRPRRAQEVLSRSETNVGLSRPSSISDDPVPKPEGGYPEIPEDAPPPIVIGEEMEEDSQPGRRYVLYVVSDLHMGSHVKYRVEKWLRRGDGKRLSEDLIESWYVDKSLSNLFDEEEKENFCKWLRFIDKEASEDHQDAECHLIINGDFLDLWQARIRRHVGMADTQQGLLSNNPLLYRNRIDWILGEKIERFIERLYYDEKGDRLETERARESIGDNPNREVILLLLRYAQRENRRVFYLVGNHDDPLYTGNHRSDGGYGYDAADAEKLREYLLSKLEVIGKSADPPIGKDAISNFRIGRLYWNRELGVYVEHGHVYDGDNWKKSETCNGQRLVEDALTEIQESAVGSFWGLASEPYHLAVKYLRCEVDTAKKKVDGEQRLSIIRRFIEEGAEALGRFYGTIEEVSPTSLSLWLAERRFSPTSVQQEDWSYFEKAKAIKDAVKSSVLSFGHTHRPLCAQYDDNSVYVNTAEWIYNIEFKSEPVCRLKKDHDRDYFLKIQPWRKQYAFETDFTAEENEEYMRVELCSWPFDARAERNPQYRANRSFRVKKRKG